MRGHRIVFLVLITHHALRTAKESIHKRIKKVADSYSGFTVYVWTEAESAKKVPSIIIFFFLHFFLKFLGLHFYVLKRVQLNLAMITVHFTYAKRRLDLLRFLSWSEGRT